MFESKTIQKINISPSIVNLSNQIKNLIFVVLKKKIQWQN